MHRFNSFGRRACAVAAAIIAVGFLGTQFTEATLSGAGATYNMADGNLAGSDDWVGLGDGACGANTRIMCSEDLPSGQRDNSFGNGTKEDTPVASVVTGAIPNNKSDLIRYYVSSEVSNTTLNNILYLAWERVQDPTGTTNMDFEFNRSRTPSRNGITPIRTHGDLLISYDLANGGTQPTIGYRVWLERADATFGPCQASTAYPCWSAVRLLDNSKFEGSINTSPIVDPIFIGSSGNRTLGVRTFGEAALDLTASGILPQTGSCFTYGSVYLKSRSSDSFTAAIKDFIAPTNVAVSNCGTLEVTKTDDSDPAVPLGNVEFKLYHDDGTVADEFDAGDTYVSGATCTTAAATTASTVLGECTMTSIPWGTFWLVETAAPTGYITSDPVEVTVSPSATSPSATVVNDRMPGSVAITKTDDADPANAVEGADFALFLDDGTTADEYDDGDTAVSGATCTTDADGECTISEVPWGTYWLVETTTPDGYSGAEAIEVTISKDNLDITQTVVNAALFKVITLVCDNTDTLVAGTVSYDGGSDQNTVTAVGELSDADLCAIASGVLITERGAVTSDISVP